MANNAYNNGYYVGSVAIRLCNPLVQALRWPTHSAGASTPLVHALHLRMLSARIKIYVEQNKNV